MGYVDSLQFDWLGNKQDEPYWKINRRREIELIQFYPSLVTGCPSLRV
jgi:hypothetical protein